ncbi:nucleotidyltransferase domain-containing protein [Billgrantia sp. Q4P2]|uniref:nucleotidyltransferase domain-containing protein n=1 Tax=Billgrantia sp. Q4P2 TaxID=3463857 RepID=UPI0040574236
MLRDSACSTDSPPPMLRLLFLLARLELSKAQEREVIALCSCIEDWAELMRYARDTFVLPLAYRHLCRFAPTLLPPDALAEMRRQCLVIVAQNLQVAAEQKRLVHELLAPLDTPYLFFKGPALAARYYDDPGVRCCGDIDLLIPRSRFPELIARALRSGYQPSDPPWLTSDQTALDFAISRQSVINILTPAGIEVEVHYQLDKRAALYDTDALLAARETLQVGDTTLHVMPTNELFVYLCLHNTRHYWSHLHWLVDMDALQRHPDFDLAAVYACARKRGLTATVDASLELDRLLADPDLDGAANELSQQGRALYQACLATLQGGLQAELALRRRRPAPEFAFGWQTTRSYRITSRLRRWAQPFRPSYFDYANHPLPPGWQWLYYLTHPCRKLRSLIMSRRSHS